GVHPAAGPANVPQQQLQHRAGADQFAAGRMLGEADRVDDRHYLVGLAHLADQLGDAHELVLRNPGNARHHVGGVARVMLLHQLEDGVRILHRHVTLRDRHRGAPSRKLRLDRRRRRRVGLVAPARDVVLAVLGVVATEEAIREPVLRLHQESGVRVAADVLVMAPLPKLAAKLTTVGPCQTRACCSRWTRPRPRITFVAKYPSSLLKAAPPAKAIPSVRFTVFPAASWATKVASLAAFTRCASLSSMSSQLIFCQRSEPDARYSGSATRRALVASCIAVAPLGQRRPSLTGLSGLPSIWSSST